MGRQRWDWGALEKEYLQSDYSTLTSFFRERYPSVPEISFRREAAKWAKKKIMPVGIVQKIPAVVNKTNESSHGRTQTIEIVTEKDLADFNHIDDRLREVIRKAKYNLLGKLTKLMSPDVEYKITDMRNLEILWKIFKVELGEPISIDLSQQFVNSNSFSEYRIETNIQ